MRQSKFEMCGVDSSGTIHLLLVAVASEDRVHLNGRPHIQAGNDQL